VDLLFLKLYNTNIRSNKNNQNELKCRRQEELTKI